MLSDESVAELKKHVEFLRHTAWVMEGEMEEKNPEEAWVWRGKMYAYELMLYEIERREKVEKKVEEKVDEHVGP